jgi:uncharacterized protein YdhG (YjbR/CyaY superfamily)
VNELEAYLETLPADQRETLDHARGVIKKAAPTAVEDLGYGMPRFKYRGKPLVAIAAWTKHLSLYGGWFAVERHPKELAPFKVVASTIQFTVERPLPDSLLTAIVRDRMAVIDGDLDAANPAKRLKKA